MNSTRNNILARLKSANTAPIKNSDIAFEPWGFDNSKSEQQKMARFCQALEASHAQVMPIDSSEISSTLAALTAQKSWHRAAIGTDGEWNNSFKQGLENLDVIEYHSDIENWKSALFHEVDVGVTHVLAGIADTGALVLWPSEHEPRTLSLVPPCHVAVMAASTLYNHFLEVMEQQNWVANMPTNALLISGPSKTADIQQTLAYGAHGPSELIVLILQDK